MVIGPLLAASTLAQTVARGLRVARTALLAAVIRTVVHGVERLKICCLVHVVLLALRVRRLVKTRPVLLKLRKFSWGHCVANQVEAVRCRVVLRAHRDVAERARRHIHRLSFVDY